MEKYCHNDDNWHQSICYHHAELSWSVSRYFKTGVLIDHNGIAWDVIRRPFGCVLPGANLKYIHKQIRIIRSYFPRSLLITEVLNIYIYIYMYMVPYMLPHISPLSYHPHAQCYGVFCWTEKLEFRFCTTFFTGVRSAVQYTIDQRTTVAVMIWYDIWYEMRCYSVIYDIYICHIIYLIISYIISYDISYNIIYHIIWYII